MDLQDLARLVQAMRGHQKDFFRTRSQSSLELSRDREKAVDAAVKEILNPQPGLFDRPPERVAGRPERMPPGSGDAP